MEFLDTLNFEQLSQQELYLVLAWIAAAGGLYAFAGYKLFRLVLALTGFGLAGAVAALLGGFLSQGNLVAMAVAGILGGICGACALFFLYRTGVFCLGFVGALVFAWQSLHGSPEPWAPWAIFGLAFLGGLGALLLEKPAMTVATSVIGGWLVAAAAAILLLGAETANQFRDRNLDIPTETGWILLAIWVGVGVMGFVVQFRMSRVRKA